jgi:Carboxypeptidase regulatory-like domain
MKKLLLLLVIAQTLVTAGCSKSKDSNTAQQPATKAVVKGTVKNTDGSPITNAKVVIEHTVYYGSYVYATTNSKGEYSAEIPGGSWKASVQIEKSFAGKQYKFDLHPDNDAPFNGSTGAVRNFTWQLSGAKPGGGFYGSNVGVYPEPGSSFMIGDVELTLTPDGPLINGTTGAAITKKLIDIGGGEDGINDVPVGKYIITAKNTATNQPLQVRYRNTGNYVNALNAIFSSGFTGSTTYQIIIQVQ